MQAVFITGHGGNEVVAVGERPRPVRGPGEVLVRLQAATLNQVDLYMRDSAAGITHRLPQIMGLDGAGIVEEVDANEVLLAPGQQVVLHPGIACGRCEFCQRGEGVLCTAIQYLGEHRDGTLAEYVSVPARNVFPMPAGLSYAEAAALGVNHLLTSKASRLDESCAREWTAQDAGDLLLWSRRAPVCATGVAPGQPRSALDFDYSCSGENVRTTAGVTAFSIEVPADPSRSWAVALNPAVVSRIECAGAAGRFLGAHLIVTPQGGTKATCVAHYLDSLAALRRLLEK